MQIGKEINKYKHDLVWVVNDYREPYNRFYHCKKCGNAYYKFYETIKNHNNVGLWNHPYDDDREDIKSNNVERQRNIRKAKWFRKDYAQAVLNNKTYIIRAQSGKIVRKDYCRTTYADLLIKEILW